MPSVIAWKPRFKLVALFLTLFGLSCHFFFVYREPSEDLIAFISKVTANNLAETDPKSPARAQPGDIVTGEKPAKKTEDGVVSPPGKSASERKLLAVTVDGTDIEGDLAPAKGSRRQRDRKSKQNQQPNNNNNPVPAATPDTEVGVRLPAAVPDAASPGAPGPVNGDLAVAPAVRYNFRKLRFNAKLHMVNQFQLFIDYPLGYWFTVDLDGASWPYMSANLISIIHPLFGLAAGYFIVKAATNARALGNQNSSGSGAAAAFEQSALVRGGSVDRSPVAATTVSGSKHDLSIVMSPSMGTGASPGVAIGSPTFDEYGNDGSERNASALLAAVNVKYLWVAAVMFWMRNFLDTLDGVVARVQRHRSGAVSAGGSATTMGFNGHSLDMVTDTLGVACIGLGIIILLFSRTNLTVARIPSQFLVRLGMPSGYLGKSQLLSKLVVICGLLYLGLTGACWETFMLRYANLFDQHANTNPAIFELDNNIHVRLTEFFWAWSCGDSLLSYLIIFMIFNKIWEGLQVFFFLGIPWCLMLTLYCTYVWNRVIMMDPTAAEIVARNPDMFL